MSSGFPITGNTNYLPVIGTPEEYTEQVKNSARSIHGQKFNLLCNRNRTGLLYYEKKSSTKKNDAVVDDNDDFSRRESTPDEM